MAVLHAAFKILSFIQIFQPFWLLSDLLANNSGRNAKNNGSLLF